MAGIDRTTLIQEFGLLQYNSQTFYSKGEITVDLVEETVDIETDAFGSTDTRVVDRRIEITLEPVGELEALSTLYPHAGLQIGESVFGGSDTAATIYTPSGKSLEISNAAITSMPVLNVAHNLTPFGPVTLTGLLQNDTAPEETGAYYTYTASGATYPGDSQFSPSTIKMLGSSAAWGATSPWDAFYTEAGWAFNFEMSLENKVADGFGTIDIVLSDMVCTATSIPLGISQSDILAARKFQGSGNELGASRAGGNDLVVTNRVGSLALHVQLYDATVTETPIRFSRAQQGNGAVTWRATRAISTGTAQPLFYVGTSAPA